MTDNWIHLIYWLEGFGWVALGCFSLHRVWLLALWFTARRRPQAVPPPPADWPVVTVQLPVFNERYVIERLLSAVAALDYPNDRLEIQVLDDSTDDTREIVAREVSRLSRDGLRIAHLHRATRAGFKAGALAEGLRAARGELIAIFDADFLPPADFLRRSVPYFSDRTVGMVQARWGHLNGSGSLLTRVEAVMLDGHFLIEQVARSRSGYFFTFNGSAGVWRRRTIDDAGGWHADTLTEDLDLSYRAQLNGWRFIYLPDLVAPAELPEQMSGFKAQQHRWTKGSIQTALKLLPAVWRSAQPLRVKLEACFHLGNWLHYPMGLLVVLLVLPILIISRGAVIVDDPVNWSWKGPLGLLFFAMSALFYGMAQRQAGVPWWRYLLQVPVFMAVTVGVALNNTRAICEALCGTPSSFTRTPKYNGQADGPKHASYRPDRSAAAAWWGAEVALGLYICTTAAYAVSHQLYGSVPFLVPLSAGFLYAGLSSVQPALWPRLRNERGSVLGRE